jgi:hypothetical protein
MRNKIKHNENNSQSKKNSEIKKIYEENKAGN